jgi:aspartate racemase
MTPFEANQLHTPYKMEDVAERLLRHVRERQPEGPYHLGGLCAGGLIAYEVANRLMAQGEQVGLLVLIEPQKPTLENGESNEFFRYELLRQRLNFHLQNLQQLQIEEASGYILARTRTLIQRLRRASWHSFYRLRLRMNDRKVRNLWDIQELAASTYRPRPYCGRVALFQAMNRPKGRDWDQRFTWKRLANNLEVYEVSGSHDSILLEPYVEAVAKKLNTCLETSRYEDPKRDQRQSNHC